MLRVMDFADSVLEPLSRAECMGLLGTVSLGRIVYTRQALPAVELVNFALDDNVDIVIRTGAGGKLTAAVSGAVVAFEADSTDLAAHVGWSVTVVGYSNEVTDPEEVRRLERLPLIPWAPGRHDHWIRLIPSIVNGRRLRVRRLARNGDPHLL